MRKICLMFLLLGVLLFQVSGANAAVLSDNFDSENGGVGVPNYASFANWTISNGHVDLIGNPGFFNLLPGNGLYVDLDGSTFATGLMTSNTVFPAGNYIFSFSLAGSQRTDNNDNGNTVDVSFGSYNASIFKNTFDPFQTYSVGVTVAAGGSAISFQNQGVSNNVGLLLDNVVVTAPLPSTLLLLGSSLAGLGLLRRKWNI